MHEKQASPALAGEKQAKQRDTKWPKGTSGNPKGQKPGYSKLQKLRAGLADHLPQILSALVEQAKAGDTQAIKLVLERTLPPMKAIEQSQPIDLPQDGSLSDLGRAALLALANGDLAPGQAAQLISALGSLAKVIEIDSLEARITELEARYAKP
jgi:hypothetical protein